MRLADALLCVGSAASAGGSCSGLLHNDGSRPRSTFRRPLTIASRSTT